MAALRQGPRHAQRPRRRRIPSWGILCIGAVIVGGGLIWSSSLYDSHDQPYLDAGTVQVLIVFIGTVGTLFGLLLKRQGETKDRIEHEFAPNHGTSLRDSNDRTERNAADARALAAKAVSDLGELREDHQQLRADVTGQASDIRGIRRDIGRLADAVAELARQKGTS